MIPRPRASNAWRIWKCPASHRAEHTFSEFGLLPAETPDLDAESGTRQHLALEGKEVTLTASEHKAVTESSQEVQDFLSREHLNASDIDEREFYLETDRWTGHLDRAVIRGKTGAVIDYKQIDWGDHFHAADNPQIWVYIYLLSQFQYLDQCWGVLKQPGREITTTLFDRKALDTVRDWAVETSKKTLDPTAEFKAGDWCQYCRLRAICPEGRDYLKHTEQIAEDELMPVGNPIVLGMLLDRFRVLGWFEDAIKNLSKVLLRQDRNSVQGWKLTSGRKVTLIKDLAHAYEITKSLGIDILSWHEPNAKKLKSELESRMTPENVSKIIEIVTEPGSLIRMNKAERKQLGYE